MSPRDLHPPDGLAVPAPPLPEIKGIERGRKIVIGAGVIALSGAVGWSLTKYPLPFILGLLGAAMGGAVIFARPFIGLLLYAVLFILRPGEMYPVLGALHLERIIGSLTLIAMFFRIYRRHGQFFLDASASTRWFVLFLVAVALSVPFAFWRTGAIDTFVDVLKILGFYLMVVHLIDTRKKFHVFLWVFLILILYLDAYSLINYYSGKAAFAQGIDRATGVNSAAGNANSLGTTMACTFPILFLLTFVERRRVGKITAFSGTLAAIWGMVLTGSRASLLGFLAGSGYLWWRSRHKLLFGALGVFLLVGGFTVIPDEYKGRYETITKSHLDESSEARVQSWVTGLEMFLDHPLFGVGAGCFGTARALAYSPGPRRIWLESHSLYVQVLAEIGIVGFIAFFGLIYQFLRQNRRVSRIVASLGSDWRFEHTVLVALFAGFIVLLVSGIFGHSLYRRSWYVYGALGLALERIVTAKTTSS